MHMKLLLIWDLFTRLLGCLFADSFASASLTAAFDAWLGVDTGLGGTGRAALSLRADLNLA
jgi:hypothetical protein